MSRTWKDKREAKMEHWMSVGIPSWWNRWMRQREREKSRQDMRNRREPQPRYGDEYYW